MASSSSVLSLGLTLGLLVLVHGCFGQILEQPWQWQGQGLQGGQLQSRRQQRHPLRFRADCRLENLNVLQPSRTIKAEAGVTEIWDENENELICAGATFLRHVIRRNGLYLPAFTNAPELFYVVQGRGLQGVAIPGCPETYQSDESQFQGRGRESRGVSERVSGDRHQKVREIREGDVLALPAGISHWISNQGQSDLVLVSIVYTSSEQNQLDENIRKFFLAGNPEQGFLGGSRRGGQSTRGRGGQQGGNFGNIFQGFDDELIAESFGVESELARRLRCEDDRRGHIVEVREELQVIRPRQEEGGRSEGWEERERGRERERERERWWSPRQGRGYSPNGLEETLCTMRLKENIENPVRADFYNPRAGRITSLNSFSLPILSYLQLSAERGVLYRDAVVAPHFYMNSHAIIYVTRGNARIQIAGDLGRAVFDGEVQENQVLVVPQNFVVIKKAGSEGFEWVAFRTNDNAMVVPLAGRLSVLRAMPEDVLVNSYGISREEARRLKYNREEVGIFSPGSRSVHGRRD
ncbi:11S globulin subunit beta-like [Punica granatum]|uniref:11S globulin subunit beta-like n=1 Tax=Punica granatum TaxID=22663 RepID=A0A218Y0C0_PUNGR|nr:11S globulin subunit beta-like [Punica granatum]OWM90480.1 hypothetical protein CDL15_Pgr014783 [Punica granatum]